MNPGQSTVATAPRTATDCRLCATKWCAPAIMKHNPLPAAPRTPRTSRVARRAMVAAAHTPFSWAPGQTGHGVLSMGRARITDCSQSEGCCRSQFASAWSAAVTAAFGGSSQHYRHLVVAGRASVPPPGVRGCDFCRLLRFDSLAWGDRVEKHAGRLHAHDCCTS